MEPTAGKPVVALRAQVALAVKPTTPPRVVEQVLPPTVRATVPPGGCCHWWR